MKSFLKQLKQAAILTGALLLLCAVLYPLALNGASQLLFSKQANGNLMEVNGKAVGSVFVGQQFTKDYFFKGRISSVQYNTYTKEDLIPDKDGNMAYGGVASGSFNYSATNPELEKRVKKDRKEFLATHPGVKEEEIPADLLTASGSGLDPHISPQAAQVQVSAVAKASGLSQEEVKDIVKNNTEHKVLGIYGEEKVNVLRTNVEIAKKMGML
ncbi:MAG: potassium-transporting ATPase subunit C [Lachnospiraceae bacterium]